MSQVIQAVRGMNDILPTETPLWQQAESLVSHVFQSYGYQEIRFPILEKSELFKRSIGEITDIVEKEMYTFVDRNQESLTLRPEGTACCVRAAIEHGLIHNQVKRLWYGGPYFRHERPQKGRYRQFSQYGAEVFGLKGPDIDAELIVMSASLLERLRIKSVATLHINTLGTPASRIEYRKHLVNYLLQHQSSLDEESLRRLDKNPLRILDSKNPAMQNIIADAPQLINFLDKEALTHFQGLQKYLRHAGISFVVNPKLVRGLDYYTHTVFEWVTDQLGAQGTICAGGRYDGLVEQLGGKSTPAMGFSLGMERAILLMKPHFPDFNAPGLHAYFILENEDAFLSGLALAENLREKIPGLRLLLHCGGGSMKNQFQKADKSGALYAIIIGEKEIETKTIAVKNLRNSSPQQTLSQDALIKLLKL